MKKLLLLLPFLALVCACNNPDPVLPPPEGPTKLVKMNKANCGLTTDDSAVAFEISLDIDGEEAQYTFEIGPNCYAHSTYEEFAIKEGGYITAKSEYYVDRLIVDYMSKNGTTFKVEDASGKTAKKHTASLPTEYSGANDYGETLEYPIKGTSWKITNSGDGFKAFLYSIRVIFIFSL